MQITSENFFKEVVLAGLNTFYKASQSGVEECKMLCNTYGDLAGFSVGGIFIPTRSVSNDSTIVFDSYGVEYYSTKEEALEGHRNSVLRYLHRLNESSLSSCPILFGNPIKL